jgi:stage III sporulation protein AF
MMNMLEIADWIKKIIAILVLAGFLEMILPNNELKGVTKMMIGLLIILIIMQPLLKFFKLPTTILGSLPAVVGVDTAGKSLPSTGRIVKEGLAVRAGWTGEIEKRNQEIVIEKIKLSIGLIDKVKLLDTKVEFNNPDLTATFGYAGLKKVKLRVEFTDSRAARRSSLARVEQERQLVGRRIRDTIKLFSNLRDDEIEVIWDG